MFKIGLLFLLVLNTTFAYELISFSSLDKRTIDEILVETNFSLSQLQDFHCDDMKRNEIFTINSNLNLNKDSLRVIGSNGKIYIFKNSKLLDSESNLEVKISDSYLNKVLKTLRRFESVPELARLVNELQFSQYPFYIKKGRNSYMPNMPGERNYFHGNNAGFISFMDDLRPIVEKFPFNQIGYGGMIFWNPATKASFIEEDYVERSVDVDLILAHEMYHAYDGMRGLLDRRFVKSDIHEFTPVSEYRAVFIENIARKSFGYKYRRFYGTGTTDQNEVKDLLDDNSDPIFIPSPCINWL